MFKLEIISRLLNQQRSFTPLHRHEPKEIVHVCFKQWRKFNERRGFDFFTAFKSPMHVIITAVLVDTVNPVSPATTQVLGVDVQSIFFNYIDTSTTGWELTPSGRSMWLDLIQADSSAAAP